MKSETEEENIDMKGLFKYAVTTLFSIIGFFLITSFNDMKTNLATLNANISQMNIEIVKIKAEMLNETKVREICGQEILKHKNSITKLQKIIGE